MKLVKQLKKSMVIIGTADLGVKGITEAIIGKGFRPVFICNMSDYRGDVRNMIKKYDYYDCGADTFKAVISTIEKNKKNIHPVEGVISTRDSGISTAILVSKHLGVRGMDTALLKINNKKYFSKFAEDFTPESELLQAGKICPKKIGNLVDKWSRVLLKPLRGTDGDGILDIKGREDIDHVYRKLENVVGSSWLAQRFAIGTNLLLEGYIQDGSPNYLGFSSSLRVGNTDSVFLYPTDSLVKEGIKQQAYSCIEQIVSRSGLQRGYFHTQFIITEDMRVLAIDPNFGRIGGSGYSHQIAYSHSITQSELFHHIIDISLYPDMVVVSPYKKGSTRLSISINYGLKDGGIVNEVNEGVVIKDCENIVEIDPATKVDKYEKGNASWIGVVTAPAESVFDYIHGISVSTDNGINTPYFGENIVELVGSILEES